jgi:hypothetical protein
MDVWQALQAELAETYTALSTMDAETLGFSLLENGYHPIGDIVQRCHDGGAIMIAEGELAIASQIYDLGDGYFLTGGIFADSTMLLLIAHRQDRWGRQILIKHI